MKKLNLYKKNYNFEISKEIPLKGNDLQKYKKMDFNDYK